MGGDTVIQLEDGEMRFRARALGFLSLKPGASVSYAIPREKLRLFEGESGRRLEGEPEIAVG
jgi:hypothetical protein